MTVYQNWFDFDIIIHVKIHFAKLYHCFWNSESACLQLMLSTINLDNTDSVLYNW